MPFLHFEVHGFCTNILFYDFHIDSIEILRQWKFVMMIKFFEVYHSWQQRKKMFGSIMFVITTFLGLTNLYKSGDET